MYVNNIVIIQMIVKVSFEREKIRAVQACLLWVSTIRLQLNSVSSSEPSFQIPFKYKIL